MHHKRLLSGPFRVRARRSPCVQTPLCPPRLRGPGHPGLQPQSTPVRGNRNTCAGVRPAGRGRGVGTTRPSPSRASCPPDVGSQSAASGTNGVPWCSDARGNQAIGRGGTLTPARWPTPTPPRKGTSPASGPVLPHLHCSPSSRVCWTPVQPNGGARSPLWAARILSTSIRGTCGSGCLVRSIN